MWKSLTTLLVIPALVMVSVEAGAQEDEHAAVLAVMQLAFAAVRSGNPDDFRAIQLPEGNTLSFRPDPEGAPGSMHMRMMQNEAGLANLKYDGRKYVERWTGDPAIMVRGPIALVWGAYDFWIDDSFSHCGYDSVQLAKVNGEWKIANWMWTVEKSGCPTDPG